MNRAELLARIAPYEYYDNSRLVKTRGCIRRAFYEQIGPRGTGLTSGTGDGATFGSVFHEGCAEYYRNFHLPMKDRRLHALDFTEKFYSTKFDPNRLDIDKKHTKWNALVLLDAYFEQFKREDENYEILAAELGLAYLIKPRPGDPPDFKVPFWYLGRMDGLYARRSTGERLVKEMKTMGSGDPAKRLELLRFNRQPVGYVSLVREYLASIGDTRNCSMFLGDVVLVSHTLFEFARDDFEVSQQRLASWRFQTILMVEEWRRFKRTMQDHFDDYNYFDYAIQDTEECNKYNMICSFYKLCQFGPMSPSLADYKPEVWTPFEDLRNDDIKFIE